MTLRTRRFLFYGLFVFFIIAGGGVVLYSRGWRINTENCSIVELLNCSVNFRKTGGVYIETEPRDATIKIDGETFPNRSGIIQKGTLISDLLPKSYKVEIAKDGYLTYYKNLKVESSLVSELFNVLLLPDKLNEKTTLIISKVRGDIMTDLSGDAKKIIVKDSATGIYRLYNSENLSSVLNLTAVFNNLKKESINKMIFHPFDVNKFIVETKSGLYILDTNRLKLETLVKPLPPAWVVKNPNVYYIKEVRGEKSEVREYGLYSFNLVVKTETELAKLTGDAGKITRLGVSDSQNKIALLNNLDDLFIFNQSDKSFKQIAHNAKNFAFSPDSKKIAILDRDGKIGVHFLEDFREGIDKKAGDIVRFNLENKSSVKTVSWYNDSYHLFIEYPDEIQFIEIDDRPPLNSYEILTGVSGFFYSPTGDKVYFTKQNSFYSFGLEK